MQSSVSIVIPTYNREKLIPNTLRNIQAQTYKNWECVVVDDHSTDNTKTIVEELAKEDSRIRYVLNERMKGAQGARNTGIINAVGEWIAFNDSDDDWMFDKLEHQMLIISQKRNNPFVVVHGNCIISDHQKNNNYKWDLPIVEGMQPYVTLLKAASPVFPSILTSKKALQEVGFLDEKVPSYQEWDTCIKLATKCEFIHIKEPLFVYHQHTGETISKDIRRDISGYHYIRLKYAKDYISHFGQDAFYASIIDNIKRAADHKYWSFGSQLLQEAKEYIPRSKYWFLASCFQFHLHPDKDLTRLHKIRKILSS